MAQDDRAVWLAMYDLGPGQHGDYEAWVNTRYIPQVMKLPGVLWAAHYRLIRDVNAPHAAITKQEVPSGSDYVLIFGGERTVTFSPGSAPFLKGGASRLEAGLDASDRARLAERQRGRTMILAEEFRLDSVGKTTPREMVTGPVIQFGNYNCSWKEEEELLAWYTDYRAPELARKPGYIGMRKYLATAGWSKHIILYEFASLAERDRIQAARTGDTTGGTEWTHRFIRRALDHAPRSPILAERIFAVS